MKKFKQDCNLDKNIIIPSQNEKYHIEGTLRHQDNLVEAKSRYGSRFKVKLINTKYFSDSVDYETIVCVKDESLVLGKPRFPENFKDSEYSEYPEYNVLVINNTLMDLLSIQLIPGPTKNNIINSNNKKIYPVSVKPEVDSERIHLEWILDNMQGTYQCFECDSSCLICGHIPDPSKGEANGTITRKSKKFLLCELCSIPYHFLHYKYKEQEKE